MEVLFLMQRLSLCLLALLICVAGVPAHAAPAAATRYQPEGTAFVIKNGRLMHNRPLYCAHMPVLAFAGDRPMLRLANKHFTLGHLMLALQRGGQAKWLQDFSEITARYRSNQMEWELRDVAFPGLTLRLQATPLADKPGYAVKLTAQGAAAQDQIIWVYGGLTRIFPTGSWMDGGEKTYDTTLIWKMDPTQFTKLTERGFVPEDCTSNTVRLKGGRALVGMDAYTQDGVSHPANIVAVACSASSATLGQADARDWKKPAALLASAPAAQTQSATATETQPTTDTQPTATESQLAATDTQPTTETQATTQPLPLSVGQAPLAAQGVTPIYWVVENFEGNEVRGEENLKAPALAFAAGLSRALALEQQVTVDTPDPYFNAAVSAAAVSIDATWYPPVYVHGGVAWNTPYPGWRTIYGGTVYGWRENVKAEAKYYIGHQEQSGVKDKPVKDETSDLARQGAESMLYGRGHIQQHCYGYNFQDQFFDQMVHAWRWTGDQELEAVLRPGLELHLDWMRRCFDPDGDGLYESYINTWPTDSVWYNGGASPEATAYAYNGERAAAEMAERAGEKDKAQAHRAQADKIRRAFIAKLWNKEKGHPGANLEQVGHQRRRDDPWLYSIFLPIDAGMLSLEEALQALHYTEWGLERIPGKFGGVKCHTSNWVPSLWSVRELHGGDIWHLALCYQQLGLAEQGWALVRGAMMESMFDMIAPGALSNYYGTDFNDLSSMFCRAAVEGVFGYKPDYPNGVVRVAPQLPAAWDRATISTPDFSLHYIQKSAAEQSLTVVLKQAAKMELRLPVRARAVGAVKLNGRPVPFEVRPGIGQAVVQVAAPRGKFAQLEVTTSGTLPLIGDVASSATAGQLVTLKAPRGQVVKFSDPQGVLEGARIENGALVGTATRNTGEHLVLAEVKLAGGQARHQQFKLTVRDPQAEAEAKAQVVETIPPTARWTPLDMTGLYNGDVRAIFKQKYLSPRPDTCSLRIRTDGYSAWNHDPKNVPEIKLDNLEKLKDARGLLKTGRAVPFRPPALEGKNIAFTSIWENWPRQVSVPVGKPASAAWFLVAGSTYAMHTRIANAELRLEYADGQVDKLALTPPLNFWSLCPWQTADYNYDRDAFCLPKTPPETLQLGQNCRAIVLSRRLRPGVELKSVTLETLSPEVVIGLMGVTLMDE